MSNLFKVGDRVRCVALELQWQYSFDIGEEFIISCLSKDCIGFISEYPIGDNEYYQEIREGKEDWWYYESFELVQSTEDIEFDNRIKDLPLE